MIRIILNRLLVYLLGLFILHFLSFTYSFSSYIDNSEENNVLTYNRNEQNQSFLTAYVNQLQGLMQLDLGTLPESEETVFERLQKSSIASLGLFIIAFSISVPSGLLIGFWAARFEPAETSPLLTWFSTAGLAAPGFYLGNLAIVAGIYYAIYSKSSVKVPIPLQGYGWDLHLVLPLLALVVRPALQIARVFSELLVEEFGKQYITTARSIGNTWNTIRNKHAFRNTLASLISTISSSTRLLITELIVVELLFGWPGLGRLLVILLVQERSPLAGSSPLFFFPPLVSSVVIIFAALFISIDFVGFTLAQIIDPRVHVSTSRTPKI